MIDTIVVCTYLLVLIGLIPTTFRIVVKLAYEQCAEGSDYVFWGVALMGFLLFWPIALPVGILSIILQRKVDQLD
jgi:hypothetical protein